VRQVVLGLAHRRRRHVGELAGLEQDREPARALAQLAEAMPAAPSSDPDEVVVDGFLAFLGSVRANPATWRLILIPAEGTPELVREHVDAGRRDVRERLEGLLERGIAARGPPGIDVELAAQSLIAVGEQMARQVLIEPGSFTPERIGGFLRALLGALERPG
jgi:AcrR family transcriptional regulator